MSDWTVTMVLYAEVTVPGDWPEAAADTEAAAMQAAEVGWREGYFRDDGIRWLEREAIHAERAVLPPAAEPRGER